MSENLFSKRYTLFLEQEAELDPEMAADQAAATQDLDHGTPEDAYDDVDGDPVANYKAAETSGQISTLQSWISELETFTEYLNGLEGDSVQSKLNSANCDTLFADISRSETKKIARIAQDLSALKESLKGYLLSSDSE